jgi:hypothetical protein
LETKRAQKESYFDDLRTDMDSVCSIEKNLKPTFEYSCLMPTPCTLYKFNEAVHHKTYKRKAIGHGEMIGCMKNQL